MQKAPQSESRHSDWPPPHKRVRGEQRQQLAQLLKTKYDAGASIRELAAETGRSYGSINRLLHEIGVTFRGRGGSRNERTVRSSSPPSRKRSSPHRVAKPQRAELAATLKHEYEATQATIGSLARKHGLNYSLVRTLLHEAGANVRQGAPA
ncbi:helix-turn-helix domain-containing protein [Streptomyces glaucus]|uniref:Helix-turn-helix domain-containing protein n=1 Tax=Streptomyces glaucus TaxID=284029 RepID=A0ABP5WY43_9ACTN